MVREAAGFELGGLEVLAARADKTGVHLTEQSQRDIYSCILKHPRQTQTQQTPQLLPDSLKVKCGYEGIADPASPCWPSANK